jgi:pyruvate dehydrogenase (quinone)
MVTWEQRVTDGAPKFEGSQVLPAFPYAEYAKLVGMHGIRCDDPANVRAAWDEAFACDRPVLVEMVADPNVPPVPPHVTNKQLKNYFSALLQRDPQAMETLKATAKEWWAGVRQR